MSKCQLCTSLPDAMAPAKLPEVRTYSRGIANFINIYRRICDTWVLIDNRNSAAVQIAEGRFDKAIDVRDPTLWNLFVEHSTMVEESVELYGEGFTDRLIEAMMRASHRMLLNAAVANELLVVGEGEFGFRHVPARELLREFEQSAHFKALLSRQS